MSDDAICANFEPVTASDEALASGAYDIPMYHYWQELPPEEQAAVFQEQTIRGERIRHFHARHSEWLAQNAPWLAKEYRQSARQARYRYFQERIAELDARSCGMENDREAVERLRKAAEEGDAGSQNNFGYLCYHGRGVEQNYAQAAHWFWLAARQKHPDGYYNRGFLYFHGRGVAQDYLKAAGCFQRAEYRYSNALFPVESGTPDIASSFGILTEASRNSDKSRKKRGCAL
jgi:TPR repeat protein